MENNKSFWLDTEKRKEYESLNENLECDVCIIGGGMAGISCSYYLSKNGFNTVVLERDKIASKTTGHTTAKITSQHDLFYDYDSVYDFEIHYDEYFSESRYIIDKKKYDFRIYGKDDPNRISLMYNFTSDFQFRDRIIVFYGNPGMGKSVTLIGSLKYCYDHDKVGTFYIHCKLLFNLIQNDYEKTKKILKEEIVYLFKNEFKQYIKCCEEIDKYIITSKTKFWDIIKIIEKFLTYKEKKYIIFLHLINIMKSQ